MTELTRAESELRPRACVLGALPTEYVPSTASFCYSHFLVLITCCPLVSSRLSVPGGCLCVCIQRGFIPRAGSSLPQAIQLVALSSPWTPSSWVAVPTNFKCHRRDPAPEAASPWVHGALSWQCWSLCRPSHKQRRPESPGVQEPQALRTASPQWGNKAI